MFKWHFNYSKNNCQIPVWNCHAETVPQSWDRAGSSVMKTYSRQSSKTKKNINIIITIWFNIGTALWIRVNTTQYKKHADPVLFSEMTVMFKYITCLNNTR